MTIRHGLSLLCVASVAWSALAPGWRGDGDGDGRSASPSSSASSKVLGSCEANACEAAAGDGMLPAVSTEVVALRLPDADPASGKSRHYAANHWFHVAEFHLHNHARLGRAAALPSARRAPTTDAANEHVVIVQLAHQKWKAQLTPMTRLLLAAAYTDGTIGRVSYAPPGTLVDDDDGGGGGGGGGAPKRPGETGSRSRVRCGWGRDSWHASTSQPVEERFVWDAGEEKTGCERRAARRVTTPAAEMNVAMGAVKAERGEWAPSRRDVASLRNTLRLLCAPPPARIIPGSNPDANARRTSGTRGDDAHARAVTALGDAPCLAFDEPADWRHAVIYQRDTGRRLEDVDRVALDLENALGWGWRVSVITHHDRLPPCMLAKCLGRARVLVTPHGFQSMLYLMLSPGALLYEVFPHRYYKHGYKRAALEWGLAHGMTLSPARGWTAEVISRGFTTAKCMSMFYCRYLARKGDVVLEARDIANIAAATEAERALGDWKAAAVEHGTALAAGAPPPAGTRVVLHSRSASRAECLAACAAKHSCQRFRLMLGEAEAARAGLGGDEEADDHGACLLRIDDRQGERDGDVIGAGIYNNKCWVPGC